LFTRAAKYQGVALLSNRNLVFKVLKVEKPKIKVLVDSVPGEGSLPHR
jgi:hypothetical protein